MCIRDSYITNWLLPFEDFRLSILSPLRNLYTSQLIYQQTFTKIERKHIIWGRKERAPLSDYNDKTNILAKLSENFYKNKPNKNVKTVDGKNSKKMLKEHTKCFTRKKSFESQI